MNSSSRNRTALKIGCALVVGAMFSARASAQALAHMRIDIRPFGFANIADAMPILHKIRAVKSPAEIALSEESSRMRCSSPALEFTE